MKTYEIETIEKQIIELTKQHDDKTAPLEKILDQLWTEIFDKDKDLRQALTDLENCNDNQYGIDEFGDVYSWVRFDLSEYKQLDLVEKLSEYLDISWVDDDNDCICQGHGDDCILINTDDRDIWQAGKLIISSKDYDTKEERNKLIEKQMEKTGYFPGVFEIDGHGNVMIVNTQPEGK